VLNDPALATVLLDKQRFQALAESSELPVPRRLEWKALHAEQGPVLVKPKARTDWENSIVKRELFGSAKACVFASGREAYGHLLLGRFAHELCFQEYVPGGDDAIWSYHGFATPEGELLASFVGRKIRTFPALTGHSSYLRLARDAELTRLARDIVARLGLVGVFKIDFKRSAANGRFYLLEINTRFNLWHYLGAKSGVNLPQVAYDYLVHGKRPAERQASLRYRWLSLETDWHAYREGASRRELTLVRWLASLFYVPKVYDFFAWRDPMPFLRYLGERLKRLPRRVRRLTLRWLSTAS
jgi:predicted ATP-grasp superfamily ATP-dependent carboligase